MNKVELLGRLTKDVDLRYSQNQTAIGSFTLAVPRVGKKDEADFISCKAFGKRAEVLEKYVKRGHKLCLVGRIETGSYEKDGHKVYTTEIIVEDFDFIETKDKTADKPKEDNDGFMSIPDNDPELPFA